MQDYLDQHLRDLPYFRALLRAVEAKFYADIELPPPVLDLGCGDGHFTSVALRRPLEVGVDLGHSSLLEAQSRHCYQGLVQADAGKMPFPDQYYSSAMSNSVLEHIPTLDEVIEETARVLKPGARFYFCVPNHQFDSNLSIAKFLNRLGLKHLATSYMRFYDRIARHQHLDSPETWTVRLEKSGFIVETWFHYFSPEALRILEWGHFFGLPSLLVYKLTGHWNLVRQPWNFQWIKRIVLKFYQESVPNPEGVCTFYVARKA
jgi:ubiquinone/menaquinone biosynthesis C-methylase UbiE